MFVVATSVHPTVGPAGFVVNGVEGCVPMTQARHYLVKELNGTDRLARWFQIWLHAIFERRRQIPLDKFLLQTSLRLQSLDGEDGVDSSIVVLLLARSLARAIVASWLLLAVFRSNRSDAESLQMRNEPLYSRL